MSRHRNGWRRDREVATPVEDSERCAGEPGACSGGRRSAGAGAGAERCPLGRSLRRLVPVLEGTDPAGLPEDR